MISETTQMLTMETIAPAIQIWCSPKTENRKSFPKGRFPVIVAHIIMAENMNSAGIVKLRKLSIPMINVNATATIT